MAGPELRFQDLESAKTRHAPKFQREGRNIEAARRDLENCALTPLAPCPHGAACNTLRARLTTRRAFNLFQLIMFPPFVMDNSGSIDSAILAFNRKLTRVLSSNSITIALK